MSHGIPGELYLIGSQQIYTLKECLEMLISLSPMKNEITYRVVPERVRPTELNTFIGKFDKFEKLTGWKSEIEFEETLKSVLNYWRDFLKKGYY